MNARCLITSLISLCLALAFTTPTQAKKNKYDLAEIRTVAVLGITVEQVNSADTQVYQGAADAAGVLLKDHMEGNEGWLFFWPSQSDLGDTSRLASVCASKRPRTRKTVQSGGPAVNYGTVMAEKYNKDGAIVKSFSLGGKKKSGPTACQAALGKLAKSLDVDAVMTTHIATGWGTPVSGVAVVASGRLVGEFLAQAGVVIVDQQGRVAFKAGASSIQQFSARFSAPLFKGRKAGAKYVGLSHRKLPQKTASTVEDALMGPVNKIKGKLKKVVKNSGTAVERGGKTPAPKKAVATEQAPAAEGTPAGDEAAVVDEAAAADEAAIAPYEAWAEEICGCSDGACRQKANAKVINLRVDSLPEGLKEQAQDAIQRGMKCAMNPGR